MHPLSSEIKSLLAVSALGLVTLSWFLHYPIPEILPRLWDLAVPFMILICAGTAGRLFFSNPLLSAAERAVFSVALGLGILAMEVFLLGLCGGLFSFALALLLGLHLAFSRSFLRDCRALRLPSTPWLWIGVALPLFIALIAALAPPSYYDALVYHLGLPNQYLIAHRLITPAANPFASFPQIMEMLFTWTLGLNTMSAPSVLVWCMGGLLAVAMGTFGERFFKEGTGPRAAALLCWTPTFLLLSADAYVDVPLTLFTFLTGYLFLLGEKYLILSGLFAGLAFGTKYTGGAVVGLITIAILLRKQNPLPFLIAALAAMSPWLIKNWATVGNPVFPFFHSLFSSSRSPWTEETAARYFAQLTEYGSFSTNLDRLLGTPWELATHGVRFGGGFDALGNIGWTLPLGLLLFAPFGSLRKKPGMALLGFLAGWFVIWGLTKPVSRFFLPALPLIILMGVHGYREWNVTAGKGWRILTYSLIGILLLSNVFLYFFIDRTIEKIPAGFGLESRQAYLTRKLNYYPAVDFMNHHLQDTDRVFIFGDQRSFYLKRPYEAVPVFAPNPLVQLVEASASPEAVASVLRQRGITHLLINRREAERLVSYDTYRFSQAGQKRWEAYLSEKTRPLYADSSCVVVAQ